MKLRFQKSQRLERTRVKLSPSDMTGPLHYELTACVFIYKSYPFKILACGGKEFMRPFTPTSSN